MQQVQPLITTGLWEHRVQPLFLRYYQQDAIQATIDAYWRGKRRMVLEIPTGGGKTIIAGGFGRRMWVPGVRILFLVPRIDLVKQTYKAFTTSFFPPEMVGMVQGDRNELDCAITIATTQTLSGEERLDALFAAQQESLFDIIIADECHFALSVSWRELVKSCLAPDGLLVGITATTQRADGQSIGQVFTDDVVYSVSFIELMMMGYLVDVVTYPVNSTPPDDLVLPEDKKLAKVLKRTYAYQQTYQQWVAHANGLRTIIFGADVPDARGWANYWTKQGQPTVVVTGSAPGWQREQEIYPGFIEQRHHLANFNVLTTGLDIAEVECIIIARNTHDSLIQQMIGRGVRLAPHINKKNLKLFRVGTQSDREQDFHLLSWGFLPGSMESREGLSLRTTFLEHLQEELVESGEAVPDEQLNEVDAEQLLPKLRTLQSHSVDIFTGHGWREHPVTHDFTRHEPMGTLVAQYQVAGYTVRFIPKSGEPVTVTSAGAVSARHAQALGHQFIESLKRREEDRAEQERSKATKASAATDKQIAYLLRRHVPFKPPLDPTNPQTSMTQADYGRIFAFIGQHRSWYAKSANQKISYVEGTGVVVEPITKERKDTPDAS